MDTHRRLATTLIDYTGRRCCIVCRRDITWGCSGCYLNGSGTHSRFTRPYTVADLDAARAESDVRPGE